MAYKKRKKKQKLPIPRMTGEEFKKLRDEMGLSQHKLALLMGLDQKALRKIEKGFQGRTVTRIHEHAIKTLLFIHLSGQMKIFRRWKYKRFVYVQPWAIYWWKRRRG